MEDTSREKQFDRILAEFFQAVDSGKAPNPADFAERFPEFAEELKDFFRTQQCFDGLQARNDETLKKAPPSSGGGDHTRVLDGSDRTHAPSQPVAQSATPFGDYELLERIAQGGMGVIYKARQVQVNRIVALKMIRGGNLTDAADRARFLVEAEAASSLDHPNIVPIYEIGLRDEQPFFTMKYIEGGSIGDRLQPLRDDPKGTARLLAQVARAVHHAHARGIVHRDLKPSNILLGSAAGDSKEVIPYVTDFGLAKFTQRNTELTRSGTVLGTPDYMSPEQAAGKADLTPASDLFSLGAMLYHLITGRKPFQGETQLEVLMQVQFLDPVPPRTIDPRVPRALEVICLKCLEKQPRRRYAGAAELADDLERFARGDDILARPIPPIARFARSLRRRPRLVFAGLLLACVAGIVAVLSLTNPAKTSQAQPDHSERAKMLQILSEAGRIDDRWHALGMLDEVPEDLRDWDWHYLLRVLRSRASVFPADVELAPFALSPDGRRALVAAKEGVLELWEPDTNERGKLQGHNAKIQRIVFDTTGTRAASRDESGRILAWDVGSKSVTHEFKAAKGDGALAFAEDGQSLVVGVRGVQVFDLETKRQRTIGERNTDYTVLTWLPAPRLLFGVTRTRSAVLLDLQGKTNRQQKSAGYVQTVSPDGKLLAFGNGKTVRVCEWNSTADQKTLTFDEPVVYLAFAGAELYAVDSERRVYLCDPQTGDKRKLHGGECPGASICHAATLSSDHERAACMTLMDKQLLVWRLLDEPARRTTVMHPSPLRGLSEVRDGRFVAGAEDGTLISWDRASNEKVQRKLDSAVTSLVAIDAASLAVGDAKGGIHILGSRDLEEVRKHTCGAAVTALITLEPLLIAGDADGTIHLIDDKTARKVSAHRGEVTGLAALPDGRLASAGQDGTARLWNEGLKTSEVWLRFDQPIRALSCHGESNTLAVVHAGQVQLFKPGNTEPRQSFSIDDVRAVTFTRDGRRLFCGIGNGTVKVVDTISGVQTLLLTGDGDLTSPLHLSADGRVLTAGSKTGAVTLWTGPSKK